MAGSLLRRLSAGAGATCVVAALCATSGAPAVAAPAASSGGPAQHVIVLLKNQHPEAPAAPATIGRRAQLVDADQAPLVRKAQGWGSRDFRQLHVTNAFAASIPSGDLAALAADPAVAGVFPDRLVQAPRHEKAQAGSAAAAGPVAGEVCPTDPAKPLLEPEALQLTHTAFADPSTPSAQQTATGRGVTVAFLADGLDINNPDFIRADGSHVFTDYQDFSGDGPNAPTSAAEAFGDASAIAAQGRQTYDLNDYVSPAHPLPAGCTIRVLGMAPDANLVGLKVFPAGGFAFNSAILAALDWAVTHDHADVINESFGSNQFPDTNDDPTAVFNEQLVKAGVTVVASSGDAGNNNTIGSPASSPGVISSAGTTMFRSYAQVTGNGFQLGNGKYRGNAISSLSSSGFTQPGRVPDLAAPGDLGWALCTPNLDLYFGCSDFKGAPASIQQFGGTSQSAPLIAGATALVIQAYRDSHRGASPSPDLVRRLLTSTADDLGLPTQEQGAGLLNTLRAVKAAQAAPGPRAKGSASDLLVSDQQLTLTTSGHAAVGTETVTNLSDRPAAVHAAVRSDDRVLATESRTVQLTNAGATTFVDQLGRTRAYVRSTFTVPAGAARLSASISEAGVNGQNVRIALLEPDGTYSAYSLPQGAGNFGFVDVPRPVAGTWTAILFTASGAAGFSGPVQLTVTSSASGRGGSAVPGDFVFGPHQSRRVVFHANGAGTPGDTADALVLTSRRAGSATATSVVPVAVRSLVDLGRNGRATVTGSYNGGNGRAGIPNPMQTYEFDVPRGARDLSVGLSVGSPADTLYGFLIDPNGQPISERTNQRVSGEDASLVDGLQSTVASPAAGRWRFVFAVFGPIKGVSTSTPYTATFALNSVRANAAGVPNSSHTVLRAGRPVTATVSFANGGTTDAAYFVDGRLTQRGTLPLVVTNPDYVLDPAPLAPFPAVRVPTQSDSLSMSANADQTVNFEVSPFPADHVTDLSFEGDPDRVGGPNGQHPSVTVSDPTVAPQTWLALPTTIGPFPAQGPTAHLSFTGSVHTRLFDPAVAASTGDPLKSYVDAAAPAASPVTVAAGGNGSITVTITPTGPRGSVVHGVLYLDTLDAVTGSTDEVAAIPYTYTIG
jgi:Subtilase family